MNEKNIDTETIQYPISATKTTTHLGPIIAVLMVLLVAILFGLYLWGSALNEQSNIPIEKSLVNNEPETPRAVADVQIIETVSSSDSLEAIEADLGSTNLDTVDTELNEILNEIDS